MKLLRLLVGSIAVVLVIAGTAVAVLLGPDDTWGGEPAAVPDARPLIVSGPRLLDVAGLSLVVTARPTGEGEAFVGAGHPVHVQDYVHDVARTEITALSASGVGESQALSGERQRPAVAPGELDVWQEQATGDPATIEVPLTEDAPVQIAAAQATGAGEAPEVGIGYALPGAFVGGLVAVLIGVLLLAGTIVLGRRAKGVDSAASEAAPQPSRTSSGTALRLAAVGSVIALATGCSIPQRVDHGAEPGVVPLVEAELSAVLEDYDERNNAAIKASHSGDGSLWASADTGPHLAIDEVAAKYNAVKKPKGKASPFHHIGEAVFAPQQASYPLWSVVPYSDPEASDDEGAGLKVVTRERVSEPWRSYSGTWVDGDVPTPLPGERATPSAADIDRAEEVDTLLGTWLESGQVDGLEVTESLERSRASAMKKQKGITRYVSSSRPWGAADDERTEQGGPVRAVRVEGGLLVLTDRAWEIRMHLDGDYVWTPSTVEREVYGYRAEATVKALRYTLTTAILVPDSGDARVIGSSAERVREFAR